MNLKKELPLIAIISLPFLYLAYVWNEIPSKVPMHWNFNGEVDRFGDKSELLLIILLPILIYITFLIKARLARNYRLKEMGNKFYKIKALLIILMSILALGLIFLAKNQDLLDPKNMFLFIGLLYITLGNYFKTLKINSFIGVRMPWTLANEIVWKETHKLAGKMWVVGGIIIVLSNFVLNKQVNSTLFLTVSAIILITPVAYSYLKYRKMQKDSYL